MPECSSSRGIPRSVSGLRLRIQGLGCKVWVSGLGVHGSYLVRSASRSPSKTSIRDFWSVTTACTETQVKTKQTLRSKQIEARYCSAPRNSNRVSCFLENEFARLCFLSVDIRVPCFLKNEFARFCLLSVDTVSQRNKHCLKIAKKTVQVAWSKLKLQTWTLIKGVSDFPRRVKLCTNMNPGTREFLGRLPLNTLRLIVPNSMIELFPRKHAKSSQQFCPPPPPRNIRERTCPAVI